MVAEAKGIHTLVTLNFKLFKIFSSGSPEACHVNYLMLTQESPDMLVIYV